MELTVSLESVCRIIVRARELEAQVPAEDVDEEAAADHDDEFAVLEDEVNESIEEEINAALAWVGRGTYDPTEWDEALEAANDREAERPMDQLLDMPMLAAYLEGGLAAFDLSCDGIGQID